MTTKNYKRRLLIGLLVFTTILLTSCEKDENKKEQDSTKNLIGTWLLTHYEGYMYDNEDQDVWDKIFTAEDNNTITFNSDKTVVDVYLGRTTTSTWGCTNGILTIGNIKFKALLTSTTLVMERHQKDEIGNELYNKGTYTKIQ